MSTKKPTSKTPQGSKKSIKHQDSDKRKSAREVHTHGSRRADEPRDQSGER